MSSLVVSAFPAYAGMIRPQHARLVVERGIPRIRGDDPDGGLTVSDLYFAFPAYAGMIQHH